MSVAASATFLCVACCRARAFRVAHGALGQNLLRSATACRAHEVERLDQLVASVEGQRDSLVRVEARRIALEVGYHPCGVDGAKTKRALPRDLHGGPPEPGIGRHRHVVLRDVALIECVCAKASEGRMPGTHFAAGSAIPA